LSFVAFQNIITIHILWLQLPQIVIRKFKQFI